MVVDGGMSTVLEQQGPDLSRRCGPPGCCGTPARIAAVHRAYFDAGAQVATTASYQASVPGFRAAGYDARGRA